MKSEFSRNGSATAVFAKPEVSTKPKPGAQISRGASRWKNRGGISIWPVWIGWIFILLTVGLPVSALLLQSIFPGLARGDFSSAFAPYRALFEMEGVGRMWQNSLTCAAATTMISWAFGLPAGWLLARVKLPGQSLIRVSMLLPMMSPPYLLALAYVLVFQANGLVDTFLFPVPEAIRSLFFSFWGVAFVMGLTNFGLVGLLVEAALRGVSIRMEDAARCLGAPGKAVFRRVTLPLLLPALLNAGALVFIDALSNFGVAAILGPRSDLLLLPAVIYELITTWPVDLPVAASISSLLALTSLIVVGFVRLVIAGRCFMNGRVSVERRLGLSCWQGMGVWAFFGGLFFFSSLLPNAAVFLMSLVETWQGGSPVLSFRHYLQLFSPEGGGLGAVVTSVSLSTAAATACVILGGVVAYAVNRHRGLLASSLENMSMLPRVLPNLVMAVGLILAWNHRWAPVPVYGTLLILFLAYVAIYQAVGVRFADAAMQQLSPRLEHAAACVGASKLAIFRRVVLPILWPSIFVAWISIFVVCLRDWVASILLLPPGAQTVGSFIFSQFEQGDFAQAMAMAVCTVLLSTILLVAANWKFYNRTLL